VYVGVVRLAISALARAQGLDETRVDDLKIAVGEACANAVLGNEEAGSDEALVVTFAADSGELTIEVNDRSANARQMTSDETDSQGFSSRFAMSVELLKSLVDKCEFLPRDGGGTQTRLSLFF
jgi:anti-sigma regulatory factor (Ser/Thr protein kinase)